MGGILYPQWLKYMEVEIVRGCVYMTYSSWDPPAISGENVICTQTIIVLVDSIALFIRPSLDRDIIDVLL